MLRILDHVAYQQVLELARQQGCFLPPEDPSRLGEPLAPILEYLDSFAGEEFKHSCRALLAAGSSPGELRVFIEFLQPDQRWEQKLQGKIFFDPGPPPSFRLRFSSPASSAA